MHAQVEVDSNENRQNCMNLKSLQIELRDRCAICLRFELSDRYLNDELG